MRSIPNRLALVSLVAAMFGAPVLAQTAQPAKPAATKPAAKPAPAKPRVTLQAAPGATVTAKPKVKLMSRDELRVCLDRNEAAKVEADAIAQADKELAKERDAVLLERDAIKAQQTEIEEAEKAILAENQVVAKRFEELKELLPKMNKKEQAEAKADYEQRAGKVNAQIEPHNARKKAFLEQVRLFEERVETFNKKKDALAERADKLGDEQDAWRNECGNKPYDEADEIAIKKEKAAAAAAAGK